MLGPGGKERGRSFDARSARDRPEPRGGSRTAGPAGRRSRLTRFTLGAITIALAGLAIVEALVVVPASLTAGNLGLDLAIYLDRAEAWLEDGSFYRQRQLAGPYVIEHGDAMYPPVLLLLLLPMTVLPPIVWWLIPVGVVGVVYARLRPSVVAWTYLALVFCWPRTWSDILYGNPAIWGVAAIAAGTLHGWPFVGAAIKPVLAPLALLGARSPSWWVAAGLVVAISVPFGSMWSDYAKVLANARNEFGIEYVAGSLPLALAPLVAWAARTSDEPQRKQDH